MEKEKKIDVSEKDFISNEKIDTLIQNLKMKKSENERMLTNLEQAKAILKYQLEDIERKIAKIQGENALIDEIMQELNELKEKKE